MKRFLSDHSGATTIEYAVLAGMIAMVLIGAMTALGDQLLVWAQGLVAAFTGIGI